jgi:hypothetical protein
VYILDGSGVDKYYVDLEECKSLCEGCMGSRELNLA